MKSYRDVVEEHANHPEPKSADANGKPCSRSTRGLLRRRAVCAESIYYVGKESNYLEDVEFGILHHPDEVQEKYFDPKEDPWTRDVVPKLKLTPRAELARVAGVTERSIRYLLSGRKCPSAKTRAALLRFAVRIGVGT